MPGIGEQRVKQIQKSWQEQKEIRNIMLFLQGHDVSAAHATKIYKTYGNESLQIVRENPYRLADDIWGIGFKTADTIADKLGFARDASVRLRSGLLYALNRLADDGHCYATREILLKTGAELLDLNNNLDNNLLSSELDDMISRRDVIQEKETDAIYLPPFYHAEIGAARRLRDIFQSATGIKIHTDGLLNEIQAETGVNYDITQLNAIEIAIKSKILILTGAGHYHGVSKRGSRDFTGRAYRSGGASIV